MAVPAPEGPPQDFRGGLMHATIAEWTDEPEVVTYTGLAQNPWRRLFAALILDAVQDFKNNGPRTNAHIYARDWLRTEICWEMCDVIGFDYGRIWRMLKEGERGRK